MTDDKHILGLTEEEFKESLLTAAIMAAVGFVVTLTGLVVRHYVSEKIR